MNLIDQHYLNKAAIPSNLAAYTHLLELVRKGCSDTTKWAGHIDSRNRREYAETLQFDILKRVVGSCSNLFSCGVGVALNAAPNSQLAMPRLPPASGFGTYEMPELSDAYRELRLVGPCGHLPGDDLMASALLLQAAAELERALSCPDGFTKLLAQQ